MCCESRALGLLGSPRADGWRGASYSEEADDLLGGPELLDNVTIASLRGTEQAVRLVDIIARTRA